MVEYAATQGISEVVRWIMVSPLYATNTITALRGNVVRLRRPLGRVPRPANMWGCVTDRGCVMGCGPRRRSDRLWLHHKSLNRRLRPGVARQTPGGRSEPYTSAGLIHWS